MALPHFKSFRALAAVHILLFGCLHQGADAHYDKMPCQPDEVRGEVQGGQGYLCAPKCETGTYNCPSDLPAMSNAQAQCMLQDIQRQAFCGLLCQVDAQCPSGARCQQLKQVEVGLCLFSISFADWARQGPSTKLAIGWPSQAAGAPPANFQVSKTYVALQNLKQKYSIDDGDADMLTLKELLASLSVSSPPSQGSQGGTVATQPQASSGGNSGSLLKPFSHDIGQFEKYMSRGLPGIEDEIHDTVWNIEHIDQYGKATMLLRCAFLWVIVYIAVGSFIKYQTTGARGIEMLPHIGFWMDYPQLVADGILYARIIIGGAVGSPVTGTKGEGSDLRGGTRSGAGSFEAL